MRLAFFFAIPRHFDFSDCDSVLSVTEGETFRILKFEPQIKLRAIRMSQNELVQMSYKGFLLRKYLCLYTVPP